MFIAQAYKGDNTPWKVILTTLISTGVFVLNFIYFLVADEEELDVAYEMMAKLPKILNLILNLVFFIPILGALFFLVYFLHKRSILSLTTARKKVDLGRVFFAFGMITVFTIISFAIGYYLDPENFEFQFNGGKFAILFIVSILLFPFQIGLEEYLFRGYLMQQIGIAARNKWLPLIITSVLFGVFHSANPEVAQYGLITMVFYIGTGLLLGVMTLMDEGMELALGFHFGNNLMAALLVTSDYSALQTDSVFKSLSDTASLTEIIAPVFIVYPIFLIILAYKYKWKGWKEKLLGKVKPPETALIDEQVTV